MPYGKTDTVKTTNVNYMGRDFNDIKSGLITYAKSYFPNTYKDFNETSPGMMLLEMSAYVGDVLNFYVDQQYREMMLPLAEERKNILTLAKSRGYKINPISPSYVDLTLSKTLPANGDGSVNYASAPIVDKGMKVKSSTDNNVIFETLDILDFNISSSSDPKAEVSEIDASTGLATTYTLKRKVRAISGETKSETFTIADPQKFQRITLLEKNVIEIIKVTDSNSNVWYEVENLSQDKVPKERHYSSDDNRSTGYMDTSGNVIKTPVPYSLEYIQTSKRFVVDVDENNKTSLIFGNGLLKNGNSFGSTFLAVEQQGINLPGGEEDLESEIDPLLGDAYGTLGEAPAHTILTIQYRIGGGINSNIPARVLTNIDSVSTFAGSTSNLTVTNENPAVGGSSGETVEEIRQRAIAHSSTQNRCVTKEDFEARALNMSAKFGNIAKVYCARSGAIRTAQRQKVANLVDRLKKVIGRNYDMFTQDIDPTERMIMMDEIKNLLDADQSGGLNKEDFEALYETLEMTFTNVTDDDRLYTVDLYLLSYDNNKNLVSTPNIIKRNLKQYLNQYRLLTDQVSFYDGYVINFGVVFDIVVQSYDNKDDVKLRCIEAIKKYFTIDKMQFKQLLYTNDVENLLMDIDGVRAVNYVTFTQDLDYNAEAGGGGTETPAFNPPLYTTTISSDGTVNNSISQTDYGYYYDFSKFYGINNIAGKGIVLPAYEPAVFELKNPNQNIKGIVR